MSYYFIVNFLFPAWLGIDRVKTIRLQRMINRRYERDIATPSTSRQRQANDGEDVENIMLQDAVSGRGPRLEFVVNETALAQIHKKNPKKFHKNNKQQNVSSQAATKKNSKPHQNPVPTNKTTNTQQSSPVESAPTKNTVTNIHHNPTWNPSLVENTTETASINNNIFGHSAASLHSDDEIFEDSHNNSNEFSFLDIAKRRGTDDENLPTNNLSASTKSLSTHGNDDKSTVNEDENETTPKTKYQQQVENSSEDEANETPPTIVKIKKTKTLIADVHASPEFKDNSPRNCKKIRGKKRNGINNTPQTNTIVTRSKAKMDNEEA